MKKHKCIDCDNLVYRKEAKRCKPCANRIIAKTRDKTYWKSKEFSKLISRIAKERLKNPENHPLYKDGRDIGMATCKECNKSISGTGVRGKGFCKSCSHIGKRNYQWLGGIANLPYTYEFNNALKEYIRNRDKNKCQICANKNKVKKIKHSSYRLQ